VGYIGFTQFYPGKTDCFTQFYPILPIWFYPLGKTTLPTLIKFVCKSVIKVTCILSSLVFLLFHKYRDSASW